MTEANPTTDATTIDDRFLTTQEVADFCRLNKSWFERARVNGKGEGPPVYRPSNGVCLYRERDVVEWLDSCRE